MSLKDVWEFSTGFKEKNPDSLKLERFYGCRRFQDDFGAQTAEHDN